MNIGRLPNYRASQTRCNQYSSTATPDPMTTPLRPSTPTISNRIPELDPFPLESVPFPDVKFPLSDALVPVLALIPAVIDPFFNDPEVVLEYRERVIRNLQWNLLNSKSWSKYLLHSTSARYDHTQSRHTRSGETTLTALVVVPSLLSIRSPPFPPLSAAEVEVNPALPPPLSAAGAEVVPGTVPDDNVCMMPTCCAGAEVVPASESEDDICMTPTSCVAPELNGDDPEQGVQVVTAIQDVEPEPDSGCAPPAGEAEPDPPPPA